MSIVYGSILQAYGNTFHISGNRISHALATIVPVCFLIASLVSGSLSDTSFGKYKIIKGGFVLNFLAAVIYCIGILAADALVITTDNKFIVDCVSFVVFSVGYACFLATSIPVGLEQLPDVSSESISSFISWYLLSYGLGTWIGTVFHSVYLRCINEAHTKLIFNELLVLFIVSCASAILISVFLLAPKWLIIEPKAQPQTIRSIYRVLKFAAKHKAPLNRSAFTYWEEDIPSRIDLGKTKYGGPFTTEQVEDVKTIIGILTLFLPMWICLLVLANPIILDPPDGTFGMTVCTAELLNLSHSSPLWIAIGSLVNEFIIYPLLRHRMPNILQQIQMTFFFLTALYVFLLVLAILHFAGLGKDIMSFGSILYGIINGLLTRAYFTSVLEFVCAQSPSHTKGRFFCLVYFQYLSSEVFSYIFIDYFRHSCKAEYCSVVYWSVTTVISLVGFLLICFVARRYKKRERDDIYDSQRLVEEVYDRYLSQRTISKKFGTQN